MPEQVVKIAKVTLKLDGEAEYQKGLQESNRLLKSNSSELKLFDTQNKLSGNTLETLQGRTKFLNTQYDAQQEKLKKLEDIMSAVNKRYGESSNTAADLREEIARNKIKLEEYSNSIKENAAAVVNQEEKLKKAAIAEAQHAAEAKKAAIELAKHESKLIQVGNAALATSKKLEAFSQKAGRVGNAMSMYATAPILAAGTAAVKMASDYQESLNKVDVAYKDNAEEVTDWSKTTLQKLGLSKGTASDMAATYGDMGTAMGFTTREMAKFGTQLVGRAADLSSFKNIKIDVANTALTAVFTGETESLKKMGVIMTQANLDQFALANGYAKTTKEMNQKELVELRLAYVMKMTSNAAGDFERTLGGTANQSRVFTESIKELGISFGDELLPVITPFIKSLNGMVQEFGELDEGTKQFILGSLAVIAAIGPLAKGFQFATSTATALTESYGKLMIKIGEKKAIEQVTGAIGTGSVGFTGALGALGVAAGIATVLIGGSILVVQNMTKESRAATDATKAYVSELDAANQAFADQVEGIKNNAISAQALANKLDELTKKESLSNTEKEIMVGLVDQLNQALPNLGLSINAETGELNKQVVAINDYIDAMKQQLMFEAEKGKLLDDYKALSVATDKQAAAQERVARAQKAINDLPKYIQFGLTGAKERYELKYAQEELDLLNDKVLELTGSVAGSEKALEETFTASTKSLEEGTQVTEEELLKQTQAHEASTARIAKMYEQQAIDRETYQKELEQLTSEHMQNMGGLEDEGIKKTELTAKQIKKNLIKQQKDFLDWREGIKKLSSRVPADVMSELEKLGPEMDPVIDDLNKYSDEKLKEWIEVWRGSSELATDAAKEELRKMPGALATIAGETKKEILAELLGLSADMEKIGKDAVDGLITGMDARKSAVRRSSTGIAYLVPHAMRNELQSKSPSRVTARIADDTIDGFIGQMKKREQDAKLAAMSLTGTMLDGLAPGDLRTLDVKQTSQAFTASRGSSTVVEHRHSFPDGLTVKGVNDKGQVVGIVEMLTNELGFEHLMAGTY